jgi:PTH1 family peptidyl-tRNA hydrolase
MASERPSHALEAPASSENKPDVKFLVVGLGNPGDNAAGHRHNVGARCLARLAKRHGVALKAGRLANEGRFRLDEHEVVLIRPRTYMNRSGDSVGPIARREGIAPENVIVVYDELDMETGRIRLRPKGGTAGHNGLKSIAAALGSEAFGRVRIGIGRPLVDGEPTWEPEVVAAWVLADPPKAEREVIDSALDRACDAIESVIRDGFEAAMNEYNRR